MIGSKRDLRLLLATTQTTVVITRREIKPLLSGQCRYRLSLAGTMIVGRSVLHLRIGLTMQGAGLTPTGTTLPTESVSVAFVGGKSTTTLYRVALTTGFAATIAIIDKMREGGNEGIGTKRIFNVS